MVKDSWSRTGRSDSHSSLRLSSSRPLNNIWSNRSRCRCLSSPAGLWRTLSTLNQPPPTKPRSKKWCTSQTWRQLLFPTTCSKWLKPKRNCSGSRTSHSANSSASSIVKGLETRRRTLMRSTTSLCKTSRPSAKSSRTRWLCATVAVGSRLPLT